MNSYYHSSQYCYDIVNSFSPGSQNYESLVYYCGKIFVSEVESKYSDPMVWIGIYIAIASLFCILAMAADLLHGFRNRKLWFPCKYFSLNAASITVITIAMKLPMDLSSPMPGFVEQTTKMGSMAFMCTMMANLMPSLVSMDNNTLLANVITMIVNIYIEISTDVKFAFSTTKYNLMNFKTVAYVYLTMIFLLLIILISSATTIPTFKKILEFKYQATSKTAANDQHIRMSTIEKLKQYVRRYWVMTESGSPQFVMASNPLSYVSSMICVISLVTYIPMVLKIYLRGRFLENQSGYKWSILVICIIQFIGVVVGSIAPIFRFFTVLRFKLFTKWDRNHLVVFKVEKYWTQKLYGWKQSRLPFLSSCGRSRALVHNLKNFVLSLCIGFQNIIVVSCKMVGLTRIVLVIFVVCCSYCWKSLKPLLFTTSIASSTSDDINKDLGNYVLHIEDEMTFVEKILEGISCSMNRLIQKVEKEQHNDLLQLLEKSSGFEGVENFDIDQVQSLLSVEPVHGWSLPVVTLTCIAIALPNIRKDKVKRLLKNVEDGLSYTLIVEETLNSASEEYVNVQKATMNIWHEVEDSNKWLENTLKRNGHKGKTSAEILKWFAVKAEENVTKFKKSTHGELMGRFPYKLSVANSMYRIARTILLNYQSNMEPISDEQMFELLSCMIADILSACLTNIPRVITMKCHESVIEKREASVEAATKLLGRSTAIITKLEACELPNMDPDKMIFIDEWRLHLKQSIP